MPASRSTRGVPPARAASKRSNTSRSIFNSLPSRTRLCQLSPRSRQGDKETRRQGDRLCPCLLVSPSPCLPLSLSPPLDEEAPSELNGPMRQRNRQHLLPDGLEGFLPGLHRTLASQFFRQRHGVFPREVPGHVR